jgi:hydroxyacylglutathione hydrolase
MKPRLRKILRNVAIALILLPVVLVIVMRLLRPQHRAARTIAGGVVEVRNFFTEIYGARVGDKIVLFDAGVDPAGGAVDALLAALGGSCADVTDVFLSHGHFDHVAAAPHCPGAKIHVGVEDVELLARRAPIEPAAARWFERVLPVPPVEATDPLRARSEVALAGGKRVVAIPLPGHTPGSYLYLYEGVLFAGDSMQIQDDRLAFAMPAFTVDVDGNKRNIARLESLLAGAKVEVVCTGHQGCTRPADTPRLLADLIARAR